MARYRLGQPPSQNAEAVRARRIATDPDAECAHCRRRYPDVKFATKTKCRKCRYAQYQAEYSRRRWKDDPGLRERTKERNRERELALRGDPVRYAKVLAERAARKRERRLDPEQRAREGESGREWRARNPKTTMLMRSRARARQRGLAFDLTEDDIVIPPWCPVLGLPLELVAMSRVANRDMAPSLDRIDNSKGYVRGNVRVISWRANRLKSDASLDELRKIVAYLEKP